MHSKYWEIIYEQNKQLNLYPWSNIVSFLFRYRTYFVDSPGSILELGCGSGANLHPFANLGKDCIGIDLSSSAVDFARKYANKSSLDINFKQLDLLSNNVNEYFRELDVKFCSIIDRACFTCIEFNKLIKFLSIIRPFCVDKCKLFFNPYSISDSSCPVDHCSYIKPNYNSHLSDVPFIMYYDKDLIVRLADILSFKILSIRHIEQEEVYACLESSNSSKVATYEVILES